MWVEVVRARGGEDGRQEHRYAVSKGPQREQGLTSYVVLSFLAVKVKKIT